jgi:hypothetical protein
MDVTRRTVVAGALAMAATMPARLRAQGKVPLRIGVLNDQSGPFADLSGLGSVEAARLAVEDHGGRQWPCGPSTCRRSSEQAGHRHRHPAEMARRRQCAGGIRPRQFSHGRLVHDMLLVEVKSPEESKYPWDYYKIKSVLAGAEAFRPLGEGGCPFVRT